MGLIFFCNPKSLIHSCLYARVSSLVLMIAFVLPFLALIFTSFPFHVHPSLHSLHVIFPCIPSMYSFRVFPPCVPLTYSLPCIPQFLSSNLLVILANPIVNSTTSL